MTKDLTKGPPSQCIIGFSIPLFFSLLFQQLYNMADSMIVGNFLGLNPLAGVGATTSLYFLVIGSATGICSGFAIPVAQMFGARDEEGVRRFSVNSAWLSIFLSLILTVVTVVWCRPMLTLMGTPAGAYEYAYRYIVVIFAGIPFTILYNMTASILRALGDSKSPLVFLVISSVLNIVLALVFTLLFRMNVEGTALATVISQGISGIICYFYMRKNFPILRLQGDDWKPRLALMGRLCAVGLPMGFQYSITAVGSIALQYAVNSFGEMAVAGVASAQKIQTFIACPLEALGGTLATYAGQNVGAGKLSRITQGLRFSTVLGLIYSAAAAVLVFFFRIPMIRLFIQADQAQALSDASLYLLVIMPFFLFLTFVDTFRFTIQGMGYSGLAMMSGCMEMFARCFVAFVVSKQFGFPGVCFASPFAWFCADLFLIPAFFFCRKRLGCIIPQGD